jgi:hypothetical protein
MYVMEQSEIDNNQVKAYRTFLHNLGRERILSEEEYGFLLDTDNTEGNK